MRVLPLFSNQVFSSPPCRYPREEWIDQGTNELMERAKKEREAGRDADQAGDYVNFEVAFAYSALPGQGDELRSKNIQ